MNRVYLDNNATTKLLPEVQEAMQRYLGGEPVNASSLHAEGRAARRAVESAREQIAQLLDAGSARVIFTSGGTEANNLAIFGFANQPARFVTSAIEHPSVLGCFDQLDARGFQTFRLAPTTHGIVSCHDFSTALKQPTRFASVMTANNETGAIQPIAEIATMARDAGVLMHTDAVQAVGKWPVSFRALGVHALSLSAHKFHGPPGIGALIVESGIQVQASLVGGHQEHGLRAGTEPVALIVGMATALALAIQNLDATNRYLQSRVHQFQEGIEARAAPVKVNGPMAAQRLPNTLNLHFPGVDAQTAVVALDLRGVACSTGSACSSGAPTPSHALLAMGLTEREARSSIRFSFSRFTTEDDVNQAIDAVATVVKHQRRPNRVDASLRVS